MTKIFSQSRNSDYDPINQEEITVTISRSVLTPTAQRTTAQDSVYQYLVNKGKLSNTQPFYILQDEDKKDLQRLGISPSMQPQPLSSTPINNVDVPIGDFHIVKGGKIKVIFSTSDSVKVQTKVKASSSSGWGVSGSVSRNLSMMSTSTYPDIVSSTSSGKYTRCFVKGNFVKEESYTVGGTIRTTIRLSSLTGGAYTGSGNCDICNMNYNSAFNGSFGNAAPISRGASVQKYKSTTTNLGLSAYASGVALGVTRITGASTNIKYSAVSSDIVLYDYDGTGRIFHMTAKNK